MTNFTFGGWGCCGFFLLYTLCTRSICCRGSSGVDDSNLMLWQGHITGYIEGWLFACGGGSSSRGQKLVAVWTTLWGLQDTVAYISFFFFFFFLYIKKKLFYYYYFSFYVRHVRREANKAANLLAKNVLMTMEDIVWMGDSPSFIQSIVLTEQVSSIWYGI
jgi:hypothetical protein